MKAKRKSQRAGHIGVIKHCLHPQVNHWSQNTSKLIVLGCCMCGGRTKARKHCPGFVHDSTGEIQRCDDCRFFADDNEAHRAHELVCRCGGR